MEQANKTGQEKTLLQQIEDKSIEFIKRYTLDLPEDIPTIEMFMYSASLNKKQVKKWKEEESELYVPIQAVIDFIQAKLADALVNKPSSYKGISYYLQSKYKDEGYGTVNNVTANIEGMSRITIDMNGLNNVKSSEENKGS